VSSTIFDAPLIVNDLRSFCTGLFRIYRKCCHYAVGARASTPGEVLLMSDYNPQSFDSRYFGPIEETAIESVVTPVLTF
jgi:hypothetical protein